MKQYARCQCRSYTLSRNGIPASLFIRKNLLPLRRRLSDFQQKSFASLRPPHELHQSAEDAARRVEDLLPRLEIALRDVEKARGPASLAEKAWQEAHEKLTTIQGEAHALESELRERAGAAFGGTDAFSKALLRRHVASRLAAAREGASDVMLWEPMSPSISSLGWLPGAMMMTQSAAMVADGDVGYLLGCVAVMMPLLDDSLRGAALHWSVAPSSDAPWASKIPMGWKTSPDVSHPRGSVAWETPMSMHAPVIGGGAATSAIVHSVVVLIPVDDFLRERGGLKFVLRRTDGGHPEWIKAGDHIDFWLDFSPAIAELRPLISPDIEEIEEQDGDGRAAKTNIDNISRNPMDSLDEWGWARALSSSSESDSEQEEIPASSLIQNDSNDRRYEALIPTEFSPIMSGEALQKWTSAIERWELLGDFPPRQPLPLSRQIEQLRALSQAVQNNLASVLSQIEDLEETLRNDLKSDTAPGGSRSRAELDLLVEKRSAVADQATLVSSLSARCQEVDQSFLHKYDAVAFEARRKQHEKERLWDLYTKANDEVHHLRVEAFAATERARREIGSLRGRSAEVGVGELAALAAHVSGANGSSSTLWSDLWPFKGGRKIVFVQQKEFSTAGVDGTVVVQVYLEGDGRKMKRAIEEYGTAFSSLSNDTDDVLSSLDGMQHDREREFIESIMSSVGSVGIGNGEDAEASDRNSFEDGGTAFDSVVIAISVGEAFPGDGFQAPMLAHCGSVSHQGGRWSSFPEGWSSEPDAQANKSSKDLPWIPLQTFSMTRSDGSPAAVDPVLHAVCLRLPLLDVVHGGVKALELVLKTADGRWIQLPGGGNFYFEIPTRSLSKQ